jgi:hypothetical protein
MEEAEANEGSMARKKRDLFRELSAGIRAMRDHAEGKVELRTTRVSSSRAKPEDVGRRSGCGVHAQRVADGTRPSSG